MSFPHGQTVTIVRGAPGGKDAYGDPVAGSSTRTDVPGCALDPRYSSEPTERGRASLLVGLTLFAPAGTDLRRTDRVEVSGIAYEVEGEPGVPVSPFSGWTPGVIAALRRAAG